MQPACHGVDAAWHHHLFCGNNDEVAFHVCPPFDEIDAHILEPLTVTDERVINNDNQDETPRPSLLKIMQP